MPRPTCLIRDCPVEGRQTSWGFLCRKHGDDRGKCAGCGQVFLSDDALLDHLTVAKTTKTTDCAVGLFRARLYPRYF